MASYDVASSVYQAVAWGAWGAPRGARHSSAIAAASAAGTSGSGAQSIYGNPRIYELAFGFRDFVSEVGMGFHSSCEPRPCPTATTVHPASALAAAAVHFSAQPEPFWSLKPFNHPKYPTKGAYVEGRGFNSSTSHFNLRRFWSLKH